MVPTLIRSSSGRYETQLAPRRYGYSLPVSPFFVGATVFLTMDACLILPMLESNTGESFAFFPSTD